MSTQESCARRSTEERRGDAALAGDSAGDAGGRRAQGNKLHGGAARRRKEGRVADSVLEPYRTEIARLYFEERNSQAKIMTYLEQAHGFRVNSGTMSRFVRTLTPPRGHIPATPNLSPDEEQFLQDAELWQRVKLALDEILRGQDALLARLEVIEDETARRHGDLDARLREGARASQPGGMSAALERLARGQQALEDRLEAMTIQAIDPQTLWQIQKKAALLTCVVCVVLFGLAWYFLTPLLASTPPPPASPPPVRQEPRKR